jgi:hypothetical protein
LLRVFSACRQGSWQGNPAKRLPPEAPIDIEVAIQSEDLGDVQPLCVPRPASGPLVPVRPAVAKAGFQGLVHQLGARLATESRFLTELLIQMVWKSKADSTHGTLQT